MQDVTKQAADHSSNLMGMIPLLSFIKSMKDGDDAVGTVGRVALDAKGNLLGAGAGGALGAITGGVAGHFLGDKETGGVNGAMAGTALGALLGAGAGGYYADKKVDELQDDRDINKAKREAEAADSVKKASFQCLIKEADVLGDIQRQQQMWNNIDQYSAGSQRIADFERAQAALTGADRARMANNRPLRSQMDIARANTAPRIQAPSLAQIQAAPAPAPKTQIPSLADIQAAPSKVPAPQAPQRPSLKLGDSTSFTFGAKPNNLTMSGPEGMNFTHAPAAAPQTPATAPKTTAAPAAKPATRPAARPNVLNTARPKPMARPRVLRGKAGLIGGLLTAAGLGAGAYAMSKIPAGSVGQPSGGTVTPNGPAPEPQQKDLDLTSANAYNKALNEGRKSDAHMIQRMNTPQQKDLTGIEALRAAGAMPDQVRGPQNSGNPFTGESGLTPGLGSGVTSQMPAPGYADQVAQLGGTLGANPAAATAAIRNRQQPVVGEAETNWQDSTPQYDPSKITRDMMRQYRRYTGARNMGSDMDRWKTWQAMQGNRNASNADYFSQMGRR